MIQIGIVDDQELVRTGFRMILESESDFEVVGEACDGRSALEMVRARRPDVVLMDVRMPEMDGVEATSKLGPDTNTKVIIVTTFDLDEYVFAALQHGASGFLLKDTPADQLIAAIRVVAAGEALLAPSITRRLIEQFQTAGPGAGTTGQDVLDALTEREAEVLTELAQGLSNAEIAEKLFVSETTIKTHVGRVLTKLNVRDRVQAVVMAYESGVVRPGAG
ncbi:MAG: response regulator [Acidimicrobiales bacterium]